VGGIRKEVRTALPEPDTEVNNGRVAVFFDRDGTLIEDVGYLASPDGLRLIPGAAEAVAQLNRRNVLTCVVSNQSGVARGLFTEADLVPIHRRLDEELAAHHARLDRIYYCPHHPTEGIPPYNRVCDCRKPATGMLDRAARDLGVVLDRSFLVGDKTIDVQTGIAAGAKAILVLTGFGAASANECRAEGITPAFVAPTVVEAVRYILQQLEENGEKHA
jgi:D-glycero-D-manno-heptose 1,7-bisphosphate phosphatase